LVFIAATLKTSDDLPDLLSSFPHIPCNVEFCVRREHSRVCVRIQCVERRSVTHNQSLYVRFVLKPLLRVVLGRTCLRSSHDCNHHHEQDQDDCPKSPHSSSDEGRVKVRVINILDAGGFSRVAALEPSHG